MGFDPRPHPGIVAQWHAWDYLVTTTMKPPYDDSVDAWLKVWLSKSKTIPLPPKHKLHQASFSGCTPGAGTNGRQGWGDRGFDPPGGGGWVCSGQFYSGPLVPKGPQTAISKDICLSQPGLGSETDR